MINHLPVRAHALLRTALLAAFIAAAGSAAQPGLAAAAAPSPLGVPAGTARYIVQLADAPLAVRPGAPKGMRAAARAPRWSPSDGQYRAALRRRQDAFVDALQAVAPGVRATYHYDVVFDGVTVRLTPEQASAASRLPGVVAVTREQAVTPLMDASLPLIGAPKAWADARIGGQMRAGRGVRIAVIDSGITAAHPFFSDGGFTAPEGFPRSTVTVGDKVTPFSAEKTAEYTNKKVIVARTYANPDVVAEGTDPTVAYDPLAKGVGGFHGAHVAGTAAGISLFGGPGTSGAGQLSLSGVAPGAYLMAYKFTDAYTPEILRMIDDAVSDGADVINNSWGTALMNIYQAAHHPVAVAFKNAHDAGVVVVAAAGNAGANGEATLGGPHQMIPEVITVANSETGRDFAYYVNAKDADLPAALAKHPAFYETFGKPVARIERTAYHNDLCNLVEMALLGRGKIQLSPWEGACATQSPLIPIPLPAQFGWVTKLINAATVQSEAVVFYTEGDLAATGALLQGLGQLLPFIAGQLPAGVTLPPVAIIGGVEAKDLAAYADAHPSLQLIYDVTPEAVFDAARVDVVNATSSRGPAPATSGGATALKPDLAAPGTNILSTNTDPITGAPAGFTAASGTSMASPHVTGAAAVVRQVWPDWTPDQVKAALLTTTSVTGKRDGDAAGG
ncbi:MAG: S8 family serine peptidase, partial [Ardenticatenales bacterium]